MPEFQIHLESTSLVVVFDGLPTLAPMPCTGTFFTTVTTVTEPCDAGKYHEITHEDSFLMSISCKIMGEESTPEVSTNGSTVRGPKMSGWNGGSQMKTLLQKQRFPKVTIEVISVRSSYRTFQTRT